MISTLRKVYHRRIQKSLIQYSYLSSNGATSIDFFKLKRNVQGELNNLPELIAAETLKNQLRNGIDLTEEKKLSLIRKFDNSMMDQDTLRKLVDASFSTFLLHVEARVASYLGVGFYTIGPCGEELLSAAACHLKEQDASALHYRHVGAAIMRQFQKGKSVDEVILDRARGFTCSLNDPVTGGKHCAIGGSSFDFLVTSTLASQCPPALGRALGIPLIHSLGLNSKFNSDSLSFVSIGDGSANNAHFLSALNLAQYSEFRRRKCPIVFGISDNGICISLRGYGWLNKLLGGLQMKLFEADGNDVLDIYCKTKLAFEYSRTHSKPSLIVYKSLTRRFGHAATDRQIAYMTASEINKNAERSNLDDLCHLAIATGTMSSEDLFSRYEQLQLIIQNSFQVAMNEPKITSRNDLINLNSAAIVGSVNSKAISRSLDRPKSKPDSMRKCMTRVFDEILSTRPEAVYMGEDVRHGGYYLVSDGLAAKYPLRVHDFPPDETTLLGAAVGFSQVGLLPIIEIPYAKYLDCGADTFYEAVISNWLSNGQQPNGMVIRLQGFDKGKFGGNFHTHNILNFPPGLDVVCYSNGLDYVNGMRYCVRQAKAGRVVMSVDSTDLLNRRHLDVNNKDNYWLTEYPSPDEDELGFDDIIVYSNQQNQNLNAKKNVLIVSYGNGLPTVLEAMGKSFSEKFQDVSIQVVDCPYLSRPPQQLKQLLASGKFSHILFCDVCKTGAGMPFAGFAVTLRDEDLLPSAWKVIGAQPTYNPLGQLLTFLSTEDVQNAFTKLINSH